VSADEQEVIDRKTDLIWKRCSEGMVFSGGICTGTATVFSHVAALMHARDQAISTGVAWRLPNAKELASIVDITRGNPAIDPVAFPVTPASPFWSASPDVGVFAVAWDVGFYGGYVLNHSRASAFNVRLVRAGQ